MSGSDGGVGSREKGREEFQKVLCQTYRKTRNNHGAVGAEVCLADTLVVGTNPG